MGALMEEFKRCLWLIIVFHGAGGMLRLVNLTEGVFARTLVSCDVPVTGETPFTGSAACGDRLLVIQDGQRLSSTAQGYECTFKVLAMIFVSVMADVIGRKPALIMGVSCTAVSTVLFMIAACNPTALFASWLFTMGQALQGAYPAELLGAIVVTDTSNEPGADIMVISTLNTIIGTTLTFSVDLLAAALNSMEMLDFRPIWAVGALINVVLAFCAVAYCRETKPEGVVKSGSMLQGVSAELKEYGSLLSSSSLLRRNLVGLALVSCVLAADTLNFSFVTSRHGLSQFGATLAFFFQAPVGVACIGLVGVLTKQLGVRKGFLSIMAFLVITDALLLPLYPVSAYAIFGHKYIRCVLSGIGPLIYAIDSRWFDQRVTAKFLAMKNLVQYLLGIGVIPLYAYLFDAKAESYLRAARPYFFQLFCTCLQCYCMLVLTWEVGSEGGLCKVLDTIEKEGALGEGSSKSAEEEKKEGKKEK